MKRASGVAIPIRFDDQCDPACTALLIVAPDGAEIIFERVQDSSSIALIER